MASPAATVEDSSRQIVKRRSGGLHHGEAIAFYLCISPWLIGFVILTLGPLLASFALSLTNWDLLTPATFAGLANYQQLAADPLFWQSLKVTSLYSFGSIPLSIALGLFVAILLNQNIKGASFWRTMFYMPSVISGVAVSLLWLWIFQPDFGVVNWLLGIIGVVGPHWLTSSTWVIPAFIIMSLWGVGGSIVINLAALQGVPTELYEASEIDGAGGWTKFRSITLPLITPVVFFNLILGIIGSYQAFTSSYVMTQGGPEYASLFYVLYLYQKAFQDLTMGYGAALAWVLLLLILVLTVIVFRSSPYWVYYEGQRRG